MKFSLSIVFQLSPSAAYSNLDAIAKNMLLGMSKLLESGKVHFTIFFDGPVLDSSRHGSRSFIFKNFKKYIENGSLELLGGSYYDSMLPLFPTELQEKQLDKHSCLLAECLGVEPLGYFNSSMVWEMEMTELLHSRHYRYALVQESAVQDALGRTTPVSGWYSLEDKGFSISVVPVSDRLSSAIANEDPLWEDLMKPYCRDGRSAVVLLNVPPQPEDIEPFFTRVAAFIEKNNLQTKTVISAINEQNSEGRLSFLLSAGCNIGLPVTARTCRELLIRRPEVNLLHKSLLSLFHRAEAALKGKDRLEFYEKLLPAMSPLYYRDLQNFEGMRTPAVRRWGTRFVLNASSCLAEKVSYDGVRLEIGDFLLEGRKQLWAENHSYSMLLDYSGGGMIRILNAKSSECNILGSWRDDGEVVAGFMDFLMPNVDVNASRLEQTLNDRDCALRGAYDYQMARHSTGLDFKLVSEQPYSNGSLNGSIHVEKKYELSSAGSDFSVDYKITNIEFAEIKGYFGTLLETGLFAFDVAKDGISIDGKDVPFDFKEPFVHPMAKTIDLIDKQSLCHVRLELSEPASLLVSPTFSAAASAAPEILQGVRVFPFWKIGLDALAEKSYKIDVRISKR